MRRMRSFLHGRRSLGLQHQVQRGNCAAMFPLYYRQTRWCGIGVRITNGNGIGDGRVEALRYGFGEIEKTDGSVLERTTRMDQQRATGGLEHESESRRHRPGESSFGQGDVGGRGQVEQRTSIIERPNGFGQRTRIVGKLGTVQAIDPRYDVEIGSTDRGSSTYDHESERGSEFVGYWIGLFIERRRRLQGKSGRNRGWYRNAARRQRRIRDSAPRTPAAGTQQRHSDS